MIAEIPKRAYKTIREVAREEIEFSEKELDKLLDAHEVTEFRVCHKLGE